MARNLLIPDQLAVQAPGMGPRRAGAGCPPPMRARVARGTSAPAHRPARRDVACAADRAREQGVLGACAAALLAAGVACAPLAVSADAARAAAPAISAASYDDLAREAKANAGRFGGVMAKDDDNENNMFLFDEKALAEARLLAKYELHVAGPEVSKLEAAPGCELCRQNRTQLEQAWQTIAMDFYDPNGNFTFGSWADKLWQTMDSYGWTLKTKEDLYRAGEKMLESLGDPYTVFLRPHEFRAETRSGVYTAAERAYLNQVSVGPGLSVGNAHPDGGVEVLGVLPESSAEAAGLKRGDRLITVDGTPVKSRAGAFRLLRGAEGSTVNVAVFHADGPSRAVDEIELERKQQRQAPVQAKWLDGPSGERVAYIRLDYVTSDATNELEWMLREGEAAGAAGYVIDVRNNPGGEFEEVLAMASYFLPDRDDDGGALITRTEFENCGGEGDVQEWRAGQLPPRVRASRGALVAPTTPVVMLVNRTSASAAEILSGALRDNGRAALIGEKTFGKGLIQYFFNVGGDGSGVKVTMGKYVTPGGQDIAKTGGLVPDIMCGDHPAGDGEPDGCIDLALAEIERRMGIDMAGSATV
ncbi:unnamed protein product [Pedinophyceae sp. YPF-701]|nr:unnamed protein product [Pedinophyceae sp. YPF-701]